MLVLRLTTIVIKFFSSVGSVNKETGLTRFERAKYGLVDKFGDLTVFL